MKRRPRSVANAFFAIGERHLRAARRTGLVLATVLSAAVLSAEPASGQLTRDRSALDKIGAALSEHYLKMNFGQAEELLLGVVKACEDKCQPATIAKAWMYVGVVRGSGKQDLHSAGQAFEEALALDPAVVLDQALATPETTATFRNARQKRPAESSPLPPIGGSATSGAAATATEKEPAARKAGLACTPSTLDVQTRRPIPVACRADGEVVRMSLRYQEHGQAAWKTVDLVRSGDDFRGQIPCDATMDSGRINFFIVATDELGDPADTLGSKSAPLRFTVDPQSDSAPAYPGEEPPARCEEKVLCPPDFPGCEDTVRERVEEAEPSVAPYNTHYIGVHFAADIGFISGSNVCSEANREFDCFANDTPYPAALPANLAMEPGELGDAYPGTGIGSGASAGTLRAMLSYDHAFTDHVSVGGRLGYAFGGAPDTLDGRSFLPVHAEARLQYWLTGLRAQGPLPYLHLGGGFAQVDIKKGSVTVRDCSEEAETGREAFLDCIAGQDAYDAANSPELPEKTLDAYRKLGNGFVTAGGGVLFSLGADAALQVNLNAMLMTPSIGFVMQPSLGLVYGL